MNKLLKILLNIADTLCLRICKLTIMVIFCAFSCESQKRMGVLHVESSLNGQFEIFKTLDENNLKLQSEKIGILNKDIKLEVGNYLILLDCSFKKISISHTKKILLKTTTFELLPPKDLEGERADFKLQCSRELSGAFKAQTYKNKFKFISLGKIEPQKILIQNTQAPLDTFSKSTVAPLNALFIQSDPDDLTLFYLEPVNQKTPKVQSFKLNQWVFLLPGDYKLTLNGSVKIISITDKQSLVIPTGKIKFNSPQKIDFNSYNKIAKNSLEIRVNNHFFINMNQSYSFLIEPIKVKLPHSNKSHTIQVIKDKPQEIPLKSVAIERSCSNWDWSCKQGKKLFVYSGSDIYPFSSGPSGIPLFYIDQNISVVLGGSEEIKLKIDPKSLNSLLKSHEISIQPQPKFDMNLLTELIRIEPKNPKMVGNSLDISPLKPTFISLIADNYVLKVYTRNLTTGKRENTSFPFTASATSVLNPISIVTFVQKRQFKSWETEYEKKINTQLPRKLY